jgi:hypothetical protein
VALCNCRVGCRRRLRLSSPVQSRGPYSARVEAGNASCEPHFPARVTSIAAQIARPMTRCAACDSTRGHAAPLAQIHRRYRAICSRHCLGACRHGAGAIAGYSRQFRRLGRLLCCCRARLGYSSDAAGTLDERLGNCVIADRWSVFVRRTIQMFKLRDRRMPISVRPLPACGSRSTSPWPPRTSAPARSATADIRR